MSIEDTVNLAKLGLKSYVRNSCERLLVAARQMADYQGESMMERNGKIKHFMVSFYDKWMMKQEKTMGVAQRNRN